MAGNERDDFRRSFVRYTVAPELAKALKPPRPSAKSLDSVEVAAPRARAIIELNSNFPGGTAAAKAEVRTRIERLGIALCLPGDSSRFYIFAWLTNDQLEALVWTPEATAEGRPPSPIHKIWQDKELKTFAGGPIRAIKADACLTAFGADGADIVVAVADSGIDGQHPHFKKHTNLDLPVGLVHRDFTTPNESPLSDENGHGTHVGGIIAGQLDDGTDHVRLGQVRDESGTITTVAKRSSDSPRGVAPKARLISLKVVDREGKGHESALIAALEYVAEANDFGRRRRVHCVNLSVGYPFDAEWFAAGHSPLCAIVNRLSRSGVVVVAAAGNDGSVRLQPSGSRQTKRVGLDQSINDPGNAEEAITVGSTHGEAPHQYGVSFFSSRGPTADGRVKPDLVAPGERILSCGVAGSRALDEMLEDAAQPFDPAATYYREESGTSMAAPHVAGAVAAFLSIRPEFIGRAETVKEIFLASCTDLKRKRDFQGAGLVDLLRAIQSV